MFHHALPLPWIATMLLQAILACVLLVKCVWRRFPIFLAYAISSFVLALTQLVLYCLSRPLAYFVAYWLSEGLGILLGLAVIYEIFKHLLEPYPALRRMTRLLLQIAVVSLILLGWFLVYIQPVGEHARIVAGFCVTEEASRILEVGLLLSLFLFASVFGLHWRQYLFGMALGLGIYAAVELVGITMRVQFGVTASAVFSMVRSVSFNASLLIWIGYILAPELATSPAEMPKRAQLEQWNRAVMELIYQ